MLKEVSIDSLKWRAFQLGLRTGADPQGGGGGGARPPVFTSNSLKSPLNWPEYVRKMAPEPPALPPFSNPGSAPGLADELWTPK